MPRGTWKTRSRSNELLPSMPPPSAPIGTRDMLSTPPAMARSMAPDAIAIAIAVKLTACKTEAQ